ncbi:OmpA-like domain-containing protein [uncultured Gammaproteobacteria bacterium]
MAIERRRHEQGEAAGENYFISMTDMMVGMLFMFIIILMFFAMKFNDISVQETEVLNSLLDADGTRNRLLQDIRALMLEKGFVVEIDPDKGILHLPENIMFDKGSYYLNPQGRRAMVTLGKALHGILPCYGGLAQQRPATCPSTQHKIEAVFVEGHTDADGDDSANWDLSIRRSLNTYQFMTDTDTELTRFVNYNGQPFFSVSGYGKHRPIRLNDSDENKRKNRRVDIRLVMAAPKANELNDRPSP